MVYNRYRGDWKNTPDRSTPITAEFLDAIDSEVAELSATTPRVVDGVLVDPDGDEIEVGGEVTSEDIVAAGAILATDAAELAAGDTVIDLTSRGTGTPLAIPHTARFALSGDDIDADGNGTIVWELTDGREITLLVSEFVIAGGAATPTGAPGAPTGLTATPGVEEVALTVTAPADTGDSALTDYTWEHRAGTSGAWTPFVHTPSTTPSITITGLTGDVLHQFRAKAKNTEGEGPASNVATATPTAAPVGGAQHDTFNRADAGVIGVSDDGLSWDVVPLPNREADPSGETLSAAHSHGIRSGHVAVLSQPGGGAYLLSRTAPDGGYLIRWKLPADDNPFFGGVRYVACFVDDENYLFVRNDGVFSVLDGSIASISGAGYDADPGLILGLEVNAARTQVRLHVQSGADPEFIGSWATLPAALAGSDECGVISGFVNGGTFPRQLVDEFWIDPVA